MKREIETTRFRFDGGGEEKGERLFHYPIKGEKKKEDRAIVFHFEV